MLQYRLFHQKVSKGRMVMVKNIWSCFEFLDFLFQSFATNCPVSRSLSASPTFQSLPLMTSRTPSCNHDINSFCVKDEDCLVRLKPSESNSQIVEGIRGRLAQWWQRANKDNSFCWKILRRLFFHLLLQGLFQHLGGLGHGEGAVWNHDASHWAG